MTNTTTPRRPRGSGSEWRDNNGKYHARKQITPNPSTGKRRWVEATGPTKTAARNKLQNKLDTMQREGTQPLTNIPTLTTWSERWLKQASRNLKPRVSETYKSECNTINKHLGGMKLNKITGTDIENMCAELSTTRSAKTVHNHYIRIKQILAAAVREKIIPTTLHSQPPHPDTNQQKQKSSHQDNPHKP
jgi:hypothetical protein